MSTIVDILRLCHTYRQSFDSQTIGSLPSADSFLGKRSDKLSGRVNVAVRISGSVFYYGFAGNRFQLFDLIETVKLFFRDCIRCKINIRKHCFYSLRPPCLLPKNTEAYTRREYDLFSVSIYRTPRRWKHERIIGSKQRDPVIDSDRCIQHVIIQVGVSAVCHRRIHKNFLLFSLLGRGFPLQAVQSGCQNDRAGSIGISASFVSFFLPKHLLSLPSFPFWQL